MATWEDDEQVIIDRGPRAPSPESRVPSPELRLSAAYSRPLVTRQQLAQRKSHSSDPSLFDLPSSDNPAPPPPSGPSVDAVALHEAAQSRYLTYALSVITSRALPDVRDGLK